MVFSAALGLAGAGIGALGSMSAAKTSASAADRQAAMQDAMQRRQLAFDREKFKVGQEQLAFERSQIERQNRVNEENRRLQAEQTQFERDLLQDRIGRLDQERAFDKDRLTSLDKANAAQRAFEIEQYLQNRNLRQDERDYALQQLDRERQLAFDERQFDLQELRRAQRQAELERSFQIDEYRDAQNQLLQEQGIQLDARADVQNQARALQDAIQQTMTAMGGVRQPERMTQADIEAIVDEQTRLHMGDAQRAAELVASQNEANLMRSGVDRSTTGDIERQKITRGIIDEFENARGRARDDALAYITGIQDSQGRDQDLAFAARGRALDEAAQPFTNTLNYLSRLPSFNSAALQPTGVGSAIYTDDPYRLTGQRSPVGINSAVFRPSVSNIGMSTGFRPNSAANIPMTTANTRVLQTQAMKPSSGIGLMQGAGGAAGAAAGRAANAAANARGRAGRAAGTAGQYAQNFGDQLGGVLDGIDFGNPFGGGGSSAVPSFVGGSGPSRSLSGLQLQTKGFSGGIGF